MPTNIYVRRLVVALLMLGPLSVAPDAKATEPATLNVELNSLTASQDGCTVSFVMRNGLESAIDALSLEIVLFGSDGRIASILTLKAGELPRGKTRVKQFHLKNCDGISRILINEVSECHGVNLTPKGCSRKLRTTNRTKVQFSS